MMNAKCYFPECHAAAQLSLDKSRQPTQMEYLMAHPGLTRKL